MQILLTNDDGIFAPGLLAIYRQLVRFGEVTVVAPAESQSGTGHSITFSKPLICNKVDINGEFKGFSVQGSPADCVKLACMQLHKKPFDLLVAGINAGANVGINIYYSGTVAAAVEAAFLKVPAVAMSLAFDEKMDYKKAAVYCAEVLEKLLPINIGEVININIPQLSHSQVRGIKVVPQSTEGFHEYYLQQETEQGQTVFQLAGGVHRPEEAATDTIALTDGFITVTALAPSMTDKKKTAKLKEFFSE
jgi:5'-nucleotidase